MSAATKPRAEPVDLYQVMEDCMSVAITRRDTYRILVAAGHRRRDPREERIIASLETAASLVEQEWFRRRDTRATTTR